jgi:hypothetical protein
LRGTSEVEGDRQHHGWFELYILHHRLQYQYTARARRYHTPSPTTKEPIERTAEGRAKGSKVQAGNPPGGRHPLSPRLSLQTRAGTGRQNGRFELV